jgi:hypothetical protein
MDQRPPAFVPPSNPEIPIWRYMDLAKFMSLLENEALHFARADLTYRLLSHYLSSAAREQIYIGVVNYIDYKTELIPWHDSFFPYVHKRKSFEYERELRALFESDYVGKIAEDNTNVENPAHDFAPPGPMVLPVEADLIC